ARLRTWRHWSEARSVPTIKQDHFSVSILASCRPALDVVRGQRRRRARLTSSLLVRYNMFGGGAQLWSSQRDLLGSFDHLCRNRPFVCGDSGMDRASLDPKALSGQKPERSVLHCCRYRVGCECGTRRFGRFANRGGAWLYRVRDRPNFSIQALLIATS